MAESSGWTERESVLLVECAVHMQEVTGHNIGDCTRRLRELIADYRKTKEQDKEQA